MPGDVCRHMSGPTSWLVVARPGRQRPRRLRAPLVLAGILTGVLSAAMGVGAWRRAGVIVAGSVLTGYAGALIVQSWLDVVGGDFWANGAALSLTVMAIAATISGLEAVMGKAGTALGALTMIFIGNPFSGVATSPDMLPTERGHARAAAPARRGRQPAAQHRVLRRRRRRRVHRACSPPGRWPGSP